MGTGDCGFFLRGESRNRQSCSFLFILDVDISFLVFVWVLGGRERFLEQVNVPDFLFILFYLMSIVDSGVVVIVVVVAALVASVTFVW